MFNKNLIFGITIALGVLLSGGAIMKPANALTIICNFTDPCFGADGDDTINGDSQDNKINAKNGNDNVYGSNGNDEICGYGGKDQILGGEGNDILSGDRGLSKFCDLAGTVINGADKILGGPGDDKLYHGPVLTEPDGQRDFLDCGPGNDEAWINSSHDHDTAINCETVHAG